jgi:nucleoside-diphosphate-sugar epimerase
MDSKRVLITGINGFTGKHLEAHLLQKGYQVYGLGASQSTDANYTQVSLLNLAHLRDVLNKIQPQIIFHLAAISFVGHGNANAFYETNVIGTRNLFVATQLELPNIESILVSSSANVYGNQLSGEINENSPFNPANDYAVSKVTVEMITKLWACKLPVFVVRPFNYTGVGQSSDFLIPKIIDHFKQKEQKIELGNIDVWREFNDVRFVVDAYYQLVNVNPIGESVNICTGKLYSLREVIAIANAITGHTIEIQVNQAFVRENEIKSLSGNPEKLKRLVPNLLNYCLKETLGWMLEPK